MAAISEFEKEKCRGQMSSFKEFLDSITDDEIYTISEFDKICRTYFMETSETKRKFPDLYGMIAKLNIDEDVYNKYSEFAGYDKVCRAMLLFRKSYLNRTMAGDKSASSGCMWLLGQPENGGMMKKEADTSVKEVAVTLNGLEGIL